MGAGKSTIGPILANTIGWDFFDLDSVIEKKEGKKVKMIFEQDGEEYFRRIESDTLMELSKNSRVVVSLGGGTMTSEMALSVLKSSGTIVYLRASPDSFYKRLRHKRDRPNLGISDNDDIVKETLLSRINELMDDRSKYYEQADIIIDTDNSSIGQTVDKIVKLLRKFSSEKI